MYVDKARLEEAQPGAFASLKALVDIGDIIGTTGSVKRTEKGELSVVARELRVLTKSLLPLPDKWHGLADVEKRYRCARWLRSRRVARCTWRCWCPGATSGCCAATAAPGLARARAACQHVHSPTRAQTQHKHKRKHTPNTHARTQAALPRPHRV